MVTLQGINISHLGKRRIIFKMPFLGDMLIPWRVLVFASCLTTFEFSEGCGLIWSRHVDLSAWALGAPYWPLLGWLDVVHWVRGLWCQRAVAEPCSRSQGFNRDRSWTNVLHSSMASSQVIVPLLALRHFDFWADQESHVPPVDNLEHHTHVRHPCDLFHGDSDLHHPWAATGWISTCDLYPYFQRCTIPFLWCCHGLRGSSEVLYVC